MTFIPEISLRGLTFRKSDISSSTPCENGHDYLFKAGLILHLKEKNKEALEFLKTCRSKMDKDFLAIAKMHLLEDKKSIKRHIQKSISNKSKRFKIMSHLRQFQKVKKEQESFIRIANKLVVSVKDLSAKETMRNNTLRQIKELGDSPWKNLLLMNLSTYSDNIFWTQKLLIKLNTYGPYVSLFYGLDKVNLNDQKLINFLSSTIDKTRKKLKNDDHKIFVSRLVDYSGRKVAYKELENRFSALWSLNELREMYSDPFIKFSYFDFILEKMLQRASESEIRNHLRQTIKKELIREMKTRQMWTLQLFFPKEDILRKSIVSKMKRVWIEGSFLEKYQVLLNLKNSTLKKRLSLRYPSLKRALFKIEKDFYTELFYSGKASLFAFHELFRLGDYKDEYLWLLSFK